MVAMVFAFFRDLYDLSMRWLAAHDQINLVRCCTKLTMGSLCAARQAAAFVRGDAVIHKLFTELAYHFKDRAGGYARLPRRRVRVGDVAPMAYIEFIDRENELRQSKPAAPQPPPRALLDTWTRSPLSRQFAPPKEDE